MDSYAQPQPGDSGYRSIPIHETGERLVSLSNLSPKIKVSPFYFQQKIPEAINDCYLRQGAAERLLRAAERLPDGLHFVVLDGWRPYEVQLALYEIHKETLRKTNGMTEGRVLQELSKFVAYPSENPDTPSPHMTGGAVDLTIADSEGWLDMGTGFDEFTEKAKTDWFESRTEFEHQEEKIRSNRRLLKTVMTSAGFMNYENEWWHYDYGNQRWAMSTGETAIYKGLRKSELLKWHNSCG